MAIMNSSKANASFDAVRRSIGNQDKKRYSLGLKRAHKLFAKRQRDLDDEQHLTVSGWLNSFPLLAEAYDLKERLYKVYEVEAKEEAWGEYLTWEALQKRVISLQQSIAKRSALRPRCITGMERLRLLQQVAAQITLNSKNNGHS